MTASIEIYLSEEQADALDEISQHFHRTPNVAAYKSIMFAKYCKLHPRSECLVLRNEEDELQKDLYVGSGLTLSFIETVPQRQDSGRGKSGTTIAASYHIEDDILPLVDELVEAGFGITRAAVISRAIWLCREVVVGLASKTRVWKFGYLREDGIFKEDRPIELAIGRRVSKNEALKIGDTVRMNAIRPEGPFDEEKARLYLGYYGISSTYKVKEFSTKILNARYDLADKIYHLTKTLALTSDEAKQYEFQIERPGVLHNQSGNVLHNTGKTDK